MVSSVLHITSQVEHIKKPNSVDSERKSVKRNADRDLSYSSCGAYFMFIELHSYVNVSSIVQGHNMVM